MSATFKVLDDKGRIHIPKHVRERLKLRPGDIVSVTVGGGGINIRKAMVIEDSNIPALAKECYTHAVIRNMDGKELLKLLIEITDIIARDLN